MSEPWWYEWWRWCSDIKKLANSADVLNPNSNLLCMVIDNDNIRLYIHSYATNHCYEIVRIFVELFCKIFSLQLSRVLVGIWDGECITIKCSNCLYNLAHFGSALQRYAGYCSVWVQSTVGVIRLIPALCHRAASTTHPQETPRVGIVKWRLGLLYSKESSWFSSFPQISLLRGILWKVQPIYF